MELTGAAEAARRVRDEKSKRWSRTMTRRGSVRVERWVRPPVPPIARTDREGLGNGKERGTAELLKSGMS